MNIQAKDLKIGQVMKIEYGRKYNFVYFTVTKVDVDDATTVHATSTVGNEVLVFSNNEKIEILEEKHEYCKNQN